mmetsp:Transcript_24603/g.48439  ORF Transcript_24603/g.48439 Transcript_24603/m.48439 type:complete len:82 (-) Transcript_24603:2279-2524(-)
MPILVCPTEVQSRYHQISGFEDPGPRSQMHTNDPYPSTQDSAAVAVLAPLLLASVAAALANAPAAVVAVCCLMRGPFRFFC